METIVYVSVQLIRASNQYAVAAAAGVMRAKILQRVCDDFPFRLMLRSNGTLANKNCTVCAVCGALYCGGGALASVL